MTAFETSCCGNFKTSISSVTSGGQTGSRRELRRRRNFSLTFRTHNFIICYSVHSLRISISLKAGRRPNQAKLGAGPEVRPRGPSGLSVVPCPESDAAQVRALTPAMRPFTRVHTLQGPALAVLKQVVSAEHTAVPRRVRGKRQIRTTLG